MNLLPALHRLSLPFALLLLGLAGGLHSTDGEPDAADATTGVAGRAALERGDASPAQAYLGSAPLVLSFAAPENPPPVRTGGGSSRCRSARDPFARMLLSRASRARSTRLERLGFANALDAARAGHRSVHSTTLPPPPDV